MLILINSYGFSRFLEMTRFVGEWSTPSKTSLSMWARAPSHKLSEKKWESAFTVASHSDVWLQQRNWSKQISVWNPQRNRWVFPIIHPSSVPSSRNTGSHQGSIENCRLIKKSHACFLNKRGLILSDFIQSRCRWSAQQEYISCMETNQFKSRCLLWTRLN